MSEAVTVKVKVTNEEQAYTKKFLCYEPITMSKSDPELLAMVEGTVKEFKGGVEDVNVTLSMVW